MVSFSKSFNLLFLFATLFIVSCSVNKHYKELRVEGLGYIIIGDTSAVVMTGYHWDIREYNVERKGRVFHLKYLERKDAIFSRCLPVEATDSISFTLLDIKSGLPRADIIMATLGDTSLNIFGKSEFQLARAGLSTDKLGELDFSITYLGTSERSLMVSDTCDYEVFININRGFLPEAFKTLEVYPKRVTLATGEVLHIKKSSSVPMSNSFKKIMGKQDTLQN